jgi:glyoxylase-like metal-dependent hydrolase (beta-lactamase superfamily II)
MDYAVHTLVNGPLEQNCYALHQQGRADCILVDPGSSPEELRAALESRGLKPALILATHGHYDHVGAVHALAAWSAAPFAMAKADEPWLEALEDSFAFYGMGSTKRPTVQRWLAHGEQVQAAGLSLQVLATPGHTPGGLCFWHPESGSLFTGDSLFAGSVGRSDMEGGDAAALIAGIKRELFPLPDSAAVLPGHGEASTLGAEKRHNRFLQ